MNQFAMLVVQVVLIIVLAQMCGVLAQKFGQSKVIGEIIAGIMLGPSLFGQLSPDAYQFIFISPGSSHLAMLGEIGLVLLMFQVGLEFDASHFKLRKNQSLGVSVAAGGLLLPFALGLGLAWWSHPYLAPTHAFGGYALFLGIALSVTAVPVLARILIDLGAAELRISRIAMFAAALTDVIAWLLLAVASALVKAGAMGEVIVTYLLLLLVYVLVCWYLLRPLLSRLLTLVADPASTLAISPMALMLIAALLSGAATSMMGFHGAFGGLMMGVLLSHREELVKAWKERLAGFVNIALVPVFFALAGARTELGAITSWSAACWFLVFFAGAVLGKFGGSYAAARAGGLNHENSRVVGILMNTRGLMELIVLTIGLDLGLIPVELFSILVFMAIITTLMTVPLVKRWLPATLGSPEPAKSDPLPLLN